MKRFGIVGVKIGCSTYFDKSSNLEYPVTVIKIPYCVVSAVKTKEVDGYNGIQVIFDNEVARERVLSKPFLGTLRKLSLPLLRYSKEFVFDSTNCAVDKFEIGMNLTSKVFDGIKKIDVTGFVKGRGFTGGMKRWGFSGLEASHGVSVSHRSIGGTGQRTDPGKCFKNKKMAGRHGMFQKTIEGLKIMSNDVENNIILIKGAVPGAMNEFIFLREASKVNY